MNTKTIYALIFMVSVVCQGCAAEIEYWTKRLEEMEKKKKASAESIEAEGTQAGVTQKAAIPPAHEPVQPPVTWPPVEWPPSEPPAPSETTAPETPATQESKPPVTPSTNGFTIVTKGGDKYLGEILEETIVFETDHGPVPVKLDNLISFAQESIKMQDGTNIKGKILQSTVRIKTAVLGELEIKAEDIESITR